MRIRYLTKKGASEDDSEQQFQKRSPYARDAIAESGLAEHFSFLDAHKGTLALDALIAEGLVPTSSKYAGPAYFACGTAGKSENRSGTGDLAAAPADEGNDPLVTAASSPATDSETVAALGGGDGDLNGLAASTLRLGDAEVPVVITTSTFETSSDLQGAVGGGPGVPTSLETAYEDPATPSVLAVNDSERQVRGARENLAGSPRADRIVGGPGKNEIDGREGNDELVGGASDDVLIGGDGDDVLDGGLGADIVRYRGSVLEYNITRLSSTQARVAQTRSRPGQNDGTDLVRNVERLDFEDRQVFVNGVNNAPLAQPDEGLSTVDGKSLTIPFARLLGNDVDFDGDRLTITGVKGNPDKSVKIVGNAVVFTPPVGVQWALADFSSYETSFFYTVSDGKGGTASAAATVTINRPRDLRGLPTGPATLEVEGAGGPGDPPGQVLTKVSGQSITGTSADDLILVPTSGAMTGGTVDGAGGVDELRFTNTGTAQTLTLGSSLTSVEQVVIGTGSGPVADTTGTIANNVNASSVAYGLLMTGNSGANTLTGTAFGDQIDGGPGADRMVGGNGDDTYFVDNAGDIVTESSSTGGTDTVYASVNYTLPARVENLVLTGIGSLNGTGNSLANTLTGNGADNTLTGAGGVDRLEGGAGNDTLDGGSGADTMLGGTGDDVYIVDNTADIVTENSAEGIDTVNSSVTYTLPANVENLVLTGTSNRNGTGNALNNTLTGNSGNNTLTGGDGDDILEGGAGNDTLDGGAGTDTARFSGIQASYTVTAGTGGSFTVTSAAEGSDTLRNIEFLEFSNITVPLGGGVNQPPVANDDSGFTTPLNTPLSIPTATLLSNDTDANGDPLSVSAVSNPSNGTVTLNGGNVVFTPANGYSGPAAFTYTAFDGQAASSPATVSVTVGSGGGGPGTYSLWSASDTPAVVTDPDSSPIELGVKFVPGQNGQITGIRFYKGPQNLGTHIGNLWTSTGTQLATATFTNETATGWQQVNFQNPVSVTAGTTYVASYFAPQAKYSVTENYFNAAYTNGPLTAPATGTSGGNGVYTYSATSAFPNATYAASNYWVDVVLQTGPVNQPPVAVADTGTTNEDTPLTVATSTLTANDSDPDGDPLTITAVGGANNGNAVLNAGNIVFTPTLNFNGAAGFTYTLSDGKGGTATGNVAVTVNPVNDPPVANNDSGFNTPFETVLNIPLSTLLSNDTDPDNDTLTVDSVGGAVNGTVDLATQTGNAVFTPNAGYSGPASFTYTIKDLANATSTATVNLTVGAGGNQPPNAVADTATTNEDSPVTVNVLANDTDPNGNPLTVTLLNLTGTQGSANINANNTVTYNPGGAFQSLNAGEQATDTFSYQVEDGQGGISSAAVTVTVTGLNEEIPNPIVAENQKVGNPESEWGINGPTSSIEGFATDISVDQGQTVSFKVNTVASAYHIDIYRMGYYNGDGARKVATIEPTSITQQPDPIQDSDGLTDASNWSISASWSVPTDAVSGAYIAKLVRDDGTLGENHMYFVVRDDDGQSDMLFQTSDSTWEAYNLWGGEDFYTGTPSSPTQAHKVSYNRPFGPATNSVNVPLMDAEYPMIRWLEANGYNVSYTTDVDTARRGQELLEHKAFLSVGHDEYWSNEQRANVEAARSAGVNLAFFSGNEGYWKTRWEDNYRTLVTYKETWSNAKVDPSPEWTGTWRDPRFSPPSDGGRPENQVSGTIFQVDSYRTDTIEIPAADGKMRFWRNTSIANLAAGQTASLTDNVLGYEWDEDRDNGFRPEGAIKLSTTSIGVSQYLLDYGNTTGPGTATHNLTLYRDPSGALVFGAGTTRWSWGLDDNHINESSTVDPRMQQATVNLFADMGIQPDSIQSGLVHATASTDTVAPVSSIVTPTGGTSFPAGQTVTITGTASDSGGGRVGGVEVSVDDGTSWHPAAGRESWSYSWRPTTPGSTVIKSRAIDDSLNMQAPTAGVTVNVQAATGPFSLFGTTAIPTLINVDDPNPVELGVKFASDVNASVTSLRFYKGSQDTGTHVGSIWTATGTKLASATFTNETASGWQQVDFTSPVPVQAGQIYVASYHTPTGFYSADVDYFATQGIDVGPLHAPASPLVAGGNGVYAYGASAFPTNSWRASNYWVDVVLANA